MKNKILLVFEGERTEVKALESIKECFFSSSKSAIIHSSFKADIYQLWKKAHEDPDLDILELLREERGEDHLSGITRKEISEIYLFFDYDGHATGASDEKIEEMLDVFCEETELGKLYISYPMIESLKSAHKNCRILKVAAKENIRFKGIAAQDTPYDDMSVITRDDWDEIFIECRKRANATVNDDFSFTEIHYEQEQIFEGQLTNHITTNNEIVVICGMPFFIKEYFGIRVKELGT